jgi:GxxExxY protein
MTIICHCKVNYVTGAVMNKFIYRNGMNGLAGDISSDINKESTSTNSININEKSSLAWNYSLIDVDELSGVVISTAKETYRALGTGLPLCVYQLKLFNNLTKEGLKLKSGKSMINRCAEEDGIRNLIVVNDVLVVEYTSSVMMSPQYEKIIKSGLHKNNYAMGLLVNVRESRGSEDKISDGKISEDQNIKITKIDQGYIAH